MTWGSNPQGRLSHGLPGLGAEKKRLTNSTTVRIFRAMSKRENTRAAILDAALAQASETGFESLTIGSLAERAGLSKSGLFAHFGSREELQVAAIEAAAARFTETVFVPALKARRGLPRLRALFENLARLDHAERLAARLPDAGGRGGVRRPARAGPRRGDRALRAARARAGPRGRARRRRGHLRADLDVGQFVFDMLGIIYAYYHSARLLHGAEAESAGARCLRAASRGRIAGS